MAPSHKRADQAKTQDHRRLGTGLGQARRSTALFGAKSLIGCASCAGVPPRGQILKPKSIGTAPVAGNSAESGTRAPKWSPLTVTDPPRLASDAAPIAADLSF